MNGKIDVTVDHRNRVANIISSRISAEYCVAPEDINNESGKYVIYRLPTSCELIKVSVEESYDLAVMVMSTMVQLEVAARVRQMSDETVLGILDLFD